MKLLSQIALVVCIAVATAFVSSPSANAADVTGPDAKVYQQTVSKAVEYLRNKGQAEDGSYSSFAGTGPTSLVTTALLRHGRSPDDPLVARSLKYLEGFVQKDGGIYKPGSKHRNYETSVALMCLTEANRDGRYDKQIKRAEAFLKGLQWDETEGKDPADPAYGGAGYGRHKRPDLSNTSFMIDALKAAGATPDDESIQRALIFVSRCQNLESEHNKTKYAAKNPDGGFYYTIAAGGSSQAGETPNGGLRSYGSMTYAGLKSMIYAGLTRDDERVKAAIKWLGKNYDLKKNPGMGDSGLYYYYHTLAKTLAVLGDKTFTTEDGTQHDWRADLVEELASRQRDDGSWINTGSARWLEGDPNLVTAYVLLALSYCQDK